MSLSVPYLPGAPGVVSPFCSKIGKSELAPAGSPEGVGFRAFRVQGLAEFMLRAFGPRVWQSILKHITLNPKPYIEPSMWRSSKLYAQLKQFRLCIPPGDCRVFAA